MKMITFFITLLLSVAMLCSSCSVTGNREKTLLGNPVVKVPTLLDKTNWTTDTIANGIIYYNFAAKDEVSDASQIVNVLELDLTNPDYTLALRYVPECSTLSELAKSAGAIAGMNAGYEQEAIYLKAENTVFSEVALAPDHLRFWKHEGAVCWSNNEDIGIWFAGKDGVDAIACYKADTHRNLIASAPMLVDNYVPCRVSFVDAAYTPEQLNGLDYEDKNRHQGVRHPRTAIALTEDRDLLLITVDGRRSGQAEGMNAKELTGFIVKYFSPQYALNMDGGGSTTMYVIGRGDNVTNVVNYPTDNGIFDHRGERKVSTHFLVMRK